MKALIVVDMQNDFIDGSLGTDEAKQIVPKVVEKINGFNGQICATFDTHNENYLDTQEGRNLPVKHCVFSTHGWCLHSAVENALSGRGVESFYKPTFGSKDLSNYIASGEFDEVVLVGLCTDICVISNAMLIKAFCPELKVTVDAACCAGVTPASHENALRAMKMCQINIENWEG